MAQSAILRFLRKRMKIIFWFTAVVFIGLVIFGWGAGVTGRGKTKRDEDANVVGKVDDYDITYIAYNEAIQNEYQRAYNENRAISEAEQQLIQDRIFNSLVNQHLAKEQFESKGIGELTNKEVFESLRRNPPDVVRNNENFVNNGQFDWALFEQYLRNPQVDWLPVEMYIRGNLPYDKLKQLVNATPVVTDIEAREEFRYRNETAKASFIKIDPFAIEEVEIDTSDAAIVEYYENHKDDYWTPRTVVVNYATLPILPSPKDSSEALALAETLLARIDRGEDFESLAEDYSNDPVTRMRGGELGWFGKEQMVPEFEEAAFAADSGEIVGPVLSDFGYHIINVLDKKGTGDSVMVRAAHILLSIQPNMDTEDSVRNLASDLVITLEESSDFFTTVEALEIDSFGQSAPLDKDDYIPGVGFLANVRAMLFNGPIGAVQSVPIRLQERPPIEGTTVIQLASRTEEGIPPLEEIRDQVVSDMLFETRKNTALKMAERAKELIENGIDIKTAAEQVGGTYDTTTTFSRADWIEGVGEDPIFKGFVFGLGKVGKISKPFLGEDGTAYIVRLEEFKPADPARFSSKELQIKNEILSIRQQDIYNRWFTNLRGQADIIDRRFIELYTPKEEKKTAEDDLINKEG